MAEMGNYVLAVARALARTQRSTGLEQFLSRDRADTDRRRQSTEQYDPLQVADTGNTGPAHRALRAQGVRGRGCLGHRFVRPVGRGAREEAGEGLITGPLKRNHLDAQSSRHLSRYQAEASGNGRVMVAQH